MEIIEQNISLQQVNLSEEIRERDILSINNKFSAGAKGLVKHPQKNYIKNYIKYNLNT